MNQASTLKLWKIISLGDLHHEPIWPGRHSNPALDLNGALNFERFMGRQTENEKEIQKKKNPQYIILECVKPQFSDDDVCKSYMVFGRSFILSADTRRLDGTATAVPVFTTVLSPATRPKGLSYLCNNKLLKPAFQHQFSCGLESQRWAVLIYDESMKEVQIALYVAKSRREWEISRDECSGLFQPGSFKEVPC